MPNKRVVVVVVVLTSAGARRDTVCDTLRFSLYVPLQTYYGC